MVYDLAIIGSGPGGYVAAIPRGATWARAWCWWKRSVWAAPA